MVVSDQEILKVFDYEGDPVLTVREVADGLKRFDIDITKEAVRMRLNEMEEEGLVNKKKFGAKAVGWWANVAPNLDSDLEEKIEKRKESEEWEKL